MALLVVLKYHITLPNTLYPITPYGFLSKGKFTIWTTFLIQLANMHGKLYLCTHYIIIVQWLYRQSLTFIASHAFVTFPPKVNIYLHYDLNPCFILWAFHIFWPVLLWLLLLYLHRFDWFSCCIYESSTSFPFFLCFMIMDALFVFEGGRNALWNNVCNNYRTPP